MNTRHPELKRHFWGTIWDCLLHNPRAIELVVTNIIVYLHLYPFSRFVVAEVDKFIERIDTGRYVDPEPMPVPANVEARPQKALAAVA